MTSNWQALKIYVGVIMQCIRRPMAKCLFTNLSEFQLYECCWGEDTDNPRQSLLGKEPLGTTVHLSSFPRKQGEGSRQEWEKCMEGKPREPQDWEGKYPNTSIMLLTEGSGDAGGSLQHPQPLCLRRAETVHHWTERGFRRVNVAPGKKRTDIHKFSCIKNLRILSLTSVCIDLEFKCCYYCKWI